MLSCLHIENAAVIERADITFDPLFNVLTGETGAGKSIMIDSLGAVLGNRTSRDIVRTGSKKALVSAVFYMPGSVAERWLLNAGIDIEDELIISREIFEDGRNVCKVQGKPVTVAALRELGSCLVNIHGQHDSQALLDDSKHMDFLDRWGGIELTEYQKVYHEWRKLLREVRSLQIDEEEKNRRIDTLTYRLEELENAQLQPGEEEELAEKRKIFKNLGKITEALNAAYEYLYGSDDYEGAIESLDAASSALQVAERYSAEVEGFIQNVQDAYYSMDDCASNIRAMLDDMDFSPMEINELEARLDIYYKLKQKYKCSSEELLEKQQIWQTELDNIVFSEQKLEKLNQQKEKLYAKLTQLGTQISNKRRQASLLLSERIQSELISLDMGKVVFSARFEEAEPSETGMDSIVFLIATNQGEPLKSLSKIASGGELARIMLALKNILAESDEIPTLVFDEVDAGVSGRAANRVALKLCDVSRHKQVLCVSHLPQIAAMADTHFLIEKGIVEQRTVTSIIRLEQEGRIEEIARIIGGAEVTGITRQHAAEMIEQAMRYKAPVSKD